MKSVDEESFLVKEYSSRAEKPKLRYRHGTITAVIPEGLKIDTRELIEGNREWFKARVADAKEYRRKIPERSFMEGETLRILNTEKEVIVEKRRSNKVEEDIILASHLIERTSLRDQLEKALRNYARQVFHTKVEKFSEMVEGESGDIFIRNQSTRWGSCSSKNNLNFNWRLILGPEHVLEYVVVHELVHLDIRDHSPKFRSKVREILPRAEESQRWLENNSAELVFDRDKHLK